MATIGGRRPSSTGVAEDRARRPRPATLAALALASAWLGAPAPAAGQEEEAAELYRVGRYDDCARAAEAGLGRVARDEALSAWKVRAEMARGRYAEALASLEEGLRRSPSSLPLRLLAGEVYRSNGRDAEASALMDETEAMILGAPRRFATPESWVALGRFFLRRGIDARKVLDQFYDVASAREPDLLAAHFAKAELALEKQDDALAAETLRAAPEAARRDPHYHYLLARALADGDRSASDEALAAALRINPNHVDSLALRADHLIDGERYEAAAKVVEQALAVNPHEPRAWAYRAVLAHLGNDPEGEASARRSALSHGPRNPEVDHLIGRKLSQKYRFAEGAARQRKALELDPEFLPARLQLGQDLLRLGEEEEGWTLADEVFAADGYNVVAYNLVTLRDHLAGFRTLEADGLVVRMDPREADLYGERVLALLGRAREVLSETYGATLEGPVTVEIFPRRGDFAVRTFGLPGAGGLLGVCFGRVITALSPAAGGASPTSWESVLWHEFCHTVTLVKTRNRMPRWLSEGISVYEERRRDPAWGAPLTPRMREMLLGPELTPLSRLSSAFLAPESPLHLQFAYYESALAVEFLVERAGLPALRGLLDDLGAGVAIEEALPRRAGMTLLEMDEAFARFARDRAESVAPGATWEAPDLPPDADSDALAGWLARHPRSVPGLRRLGTRLVAEERWDEARDVLLRLKATYPEYVGPDNPYMLLATVHRRLSDPEAERAVLAELLARDADAVPALLRRMELDEAAGDWDALAADARRMLGVNPLVPAPHRGLARAAERLGDRGEAIASYRALALMDDPDPAEVHYRLARLLRDDGREAEARREALKSLEEAPRFLDAHRLLLELADPDPPPPRPEDPPR